MSMLQLAGGVVLESSIKRSSASVALSGSPIPTACPLQRVLEHATSLLEPPGMSDPSPNEAEQRRVLGALLVVQFRPSPPPSCSLSGKLNSTDVQARTQVLIGV